MAFDPINIFSHNIDPLSVLQVMRGADLSLALPESAEDEWEVAASIKGGFLRRAKTILIGHDPEYYGGDDWPQQVMGMAGYFARFPEVERKSEILDAVRSFRFALAIRQDDLDINSNDPRLTLVYAICQELDGLIFTPSGLRDGFGRVLIDDEGASNANAVLPALAPTLAAASGEPPTNLNLPPVPATRTANLVQLSELGFTVSPGLPCDTGRTVRPVEDIARRLMALEALFIWVNADEDNVAADTVRSYVDRNDLSGWLTDDERDIFSMPRDAAQREHLDGIGWRLENMWPLAWALGFDETPPVAGGMIPGEITRGILMDFLPGPDGALSELLAKATLRDDAAIDTLEDLYYCAHNAVRSAQLGSDTVPAGFHPVGDGGVVHERRHSLTWMLSPGTPWDDTDLST